MTPYMGKGGAPRSHGRNRVTFARARDTTTKGSHSGSQPNIQLVCHACRQQQCATQEPHVQSLQNITNTGGDISVAGRDVNRTIINNNSLFGPITINFNGTNVSIYGFFVNAGHNILVSPVLAGSRGAFPSARSYKCEEQVVLNDCVALAGQKNCGYKLPPVLVVWTTTPTGGNFVNDCHMFSIERGQSFALFIPEGGTDGHSIYAIKTLAIPSTVG